MSHRKNAVVEKAVDMDDKCFVDSICIMSEVQADTPGNQMGMMLGKTPQTLTKPGRLVVRTKKNILSLSQETRDGESGACYSVELGKGVTEGKIESCKMILEV